MAVGRITGPLLKANLLRDGVPLAFETDLLYLDVVNSRVGIKTATPTHELTINGTTRTTNLITTEADIATFNIVGSTISSTNSQITLQPSGANAVVYQGKIVTGDLQISANTIETTATDLDLEINTLGTSEVNINSNVLVNGNLHATGTITADGDIQLGNNLAEDTITFSAEITSDLIPGLDDITSEPKYTLGSDANRWNNLYVKDLFAESFTTATFSVNGIDLVLPQGNIIYVATAGNNANSGTHENDPFLTVKYALSQAVSGDTVFIYPGEYLEEFPLTIPVGVTIRGASLRSVDIRPTVGTVDKDAFLINGETTVEDLTISGFRFNSGNNTGYGFRFANNFTVTTRSPYIRNVTVITRGSVTSGSDPYGFDQNDAGKGALLDGSVVNASSKEAAMLFHSCTFFTPNQETITATNGVRIEWLNSFTYFADKGLYAYSSATGFAGAGLTRLRINNRTGTWAVGNTVTYYDTNGTTVLGTGTIASIDGNYVNLTGRQLGFQTITDRVGKTVYAQGNAKLSTAQKKFGTASLALDGTGDYATVATQPDFLLGTGNWTIELWVYKTGTTGGIQQLIDFRATAPTIAPTLYLTAVGTPTFNVNAVNVITAGSAVANNTWTHIAVSKSGTSTKMFINGTQTGSTYTDNNNYIQGPLTIGARYDGASGFLGYLDDVRISKGVARYTTTFTPSTTPLTGDLNTVLLLHFNGANNSTVFLDDGITFQDLRTSAGGRASLINFADYSDFGAEIRAIGSANVYGTYGAYGTGVGVIAYLISQNFAYIGSGKLATNDPNDRIAANEVVELNGAKIYYTSVDNEGNFKVGDSFYVNQKTGEVLFNSQTLNITSAGGVTFTNGVNTTIITPTNIDTGNIRISGNTVESITGNLNITAASGAINLQNNTFITGDLDVTGDITLGGNIQIGDANTDTINFVGGINSNLVPATTNLYNLGSSVDNLWWKNIYLNRAEIDGVVIDNNQISTTVGNNDLTLVANGTGRIYVPSNNVQIDQSLTVTQDLTVTTGTTYLKTTSVTGDITQTGDINQTGTFTTSGNTQVTGNITVTGYLDLSAINITGTTIRTKVAGTDLNLVANGAGNVVIEGIKISDNNIQSVVADSNITLTPQGTGSVVINSNQSLIVPIGDNSQRPITPTNGMIRYNNQIGRYEGYNGSYWLPMSGVQDADGNTYITAESTPGANDNTLRFYADNSLMVTIDSTKLFAERLQTTALDIQDNTITTIVNNTDINLTTPGTGGVKIGNLRIRNNTIINTVAGAVTEFLETGAGYVKIAGTNGVVIPAGDTEFDRPSQPELGMMRFNTALELVEIYNGVTWSSVAGTNSGISESQATDIGILTALLFG